MKKLALLLVCLCFPVSAYSQELLYNPKDSTLVGKIASTNLISVFRVGGSNFNFSHLTVSNETRSNLDFVTLLELDDNYNAVDLIPLTLYLSSMDQSKNATRNFYKSSTSVIFKARTKYAVLWSMGSNVQKIALSGVMISKYNTGLKNIGTFSIDNNVWTPLQSNMTLRVYGSIISPLD